MPFLHTEPVWISSKPSSYIGIWPSPSSISSCSSHRLSVLIRRPFVQAASFFSGNVSWPPQSVLDFYQAMRIREAMASWDWRQRCAWMDDGGKHWDWPCSGRYLYTPDRFVGRPAALSAKWERSDVFLRTKQYTQGLLQAGKALGERTTEVIVCDEGGERSGNTVHYLNCANVFIYT